METRKLIISVYGRENLDDSKEIAILLSYKLDGKVEVDLLTEAPIKLKLKWGGWICPAKHIPKDQLM